MPSESPTVTTQGIAADKMTESVQATKESETTDDELTRIGKDIDHIRNNVLPKYLKEAGREPDYTYQK